MAWQVRDKNRVPEHRRRLDMLRSTRLDVGIIGKRSGAEVVQYAATNEFGTSRIPERSFLRSTVREKRDVYVRLLREAANAILGGAEPSVVMGRIGLRVVRDVRIKITRIRLPPNAPSTIRRKGSSNPLIDTGRMRQSITYVLRRTKLSRPSVPRPPVSPPRSR